MEVIGYLGPRGSYTSLAVTKLCSDSEAVPYKNFHEGFLRLQSGELDGIVIPIENTLNGGIVQNIDLLQSMENVAAVRECTLNIDHRLATLKGADIKNVKRIYSHAQALEQCSKFLAKNFPTAQYVPTFSTAAGLELVKTCEDACIAGAHTSREGLQLSPENIADEKKNFTHFLLIRRGSVPENTVSKKIYFSVTCKNQTGALLKLLEPVCKNGLNMTKIESRPIKDRPDEYRFFIETEGDYSSPQIKSTLEEVKRAANSFKFLGCY